MSEKIKAWRCIGCGRVETQADCIGVCDYRRVELVDARLHQARLRALEDVVRRIAFTHPRAGEHERSWLALQQNARRALAADFGGMAHADIARLAGGAAWVNGRSGQSDRC